MNKLNIMILASIVAVTLSSNAFSGLKAINNVIVGASYFYGAFGTARNSADTVQYIGCWDYGNSARCFARNSASTAKSCSTTDPNHLAVIRGLVDSTYIYVNFNTTTGACTNVYSYNNSFWEPKQP